MRRAKTLMIQGTASTVGKSTLVTGLCRIFAQDGWRVAPFKAQNMALNSWVTLRGEEMGRAQVVQAEAAGIEPRVEMNPILLKPESNTRSQVIVRGHPLAPMEARAYYQDRQQMMTVVSQSLATLCDEYDLVIIEGAGSPVELNLLAHDLVNMAVARLADAPVLLVGDIDRGGIFASLLGTLMLFEPADRQRVKALIVNKFRGDMSLWRDGESMLAERAGIPVLGTVPFFRDIRIAEEDSVPLDEGSVSIVQPGPLDDQSRVHIIVFRFPYLSNYDEFDALAADPRVSLRFIAHPLEEAFRPDLIILPGSKNTLADLAWLRSQGLDVYLQHCIQHGSALLGICGGYQMLGELLCDPAGIEQSVPATATGLGLFPLQTTFLGLEEKITRRCSARLCLSSVRGLFAHLSSDQVFHTYQIHIGRTFPSGQSSLPHTPLFLLDDQQEDGWLSSDGWQAGCYLHGLFENDAVRYAVIEALAARRSLTFAPAYNQSFQRQAEYDKLAAVLRSSLDISLLSDLCGLRKQ